MIKKLVELPKSIKNLFCLFSIAVFTFSCSEEKVAEVDVPSEVDFNFHVRPILVQNCYLCHGPDPSSREADLRLDTREGALAALKEGGHAVVPGNPGKSALVERISSVDPTLMMPPPESNLELSQRDIAILKKWIEQGAEWKPHWSLIEPAKSEPKASNNRGYIDRFVEDKIKEKGLSKSPVADKSKLIRRVSYVLTGLPPSLEDQTKYIDDQSPNAYETMVDRYLSSPAFGERWARHWMDVVRYAETKGHEFDYTISNAWQYRDYLIRAFNEDVPYDQMLREHLAGDLMEVPRWNEETQANESEIATAFYALGEGTHSPVDIKKDEADRIDNMIDVTTKTFQGLTVSCARCHDHKFDPIPTKDYYALYGVMQSSRFTPKPANMNFEKLETVKEIDQYIEEIEGLISNQSKKPSANLKGVEMLGDFRGESYGDWNSDGLAFGKSSQLISRSGNGVKVANGVASSRHYGTGIFGALRSPNFEIEKEFVGVLARGNQSSIRIIIDNFQLIQDPIYGKLQKKVEGEKYNLVEFDLSAWKGHKAYIEILPGSYMGKTPHVYQLPEDAYIEAKWVAAYNDDWNRKYSLDQNDRVFKNQDAFTLVNKKQKLANSLKDSVFYVGIDEGVGKNSPVFIRGSHTMPSEEEVPRGFLTSVVGEESAFDTKGSGRVELAESMLQDSNPLTSRVMVNRVWHHMFGKGLVETVDNFGLQGKLPSNPELLDYLAVSFKEDMNWSIKSLIREIVLSETFKREVEAEGNSDQLDPENLYLSHFPLRRLEAEAIRDGMLMVAGNFDNDLYGPPVPLYLTEFMQGRGRPSESGPLDGAGRRSIYQEVRRNFLESMMIAFDRPIPFTTFGRRNVTNVPAQSLILMNDPFVVQEAEIMAENVMASTTDADERVALIYRLALAREPSDTELENASKFIASVAMTHGLTDEQTTDSLDVWRDYCHTIFNLKEFIYLI